MSKQGYVPYVTRVANWYKGYTSMGGYFLFSPLKIRGFRAAYIGIPGKPINNNAKGFITVCLHWDQVKDVLTECKEQSSWMIVLKANQSAIYDFNN